MNLLVSLDDSQAENGGLSELDFLDDARIEIGASARQQPMSGYF